MGIPGNLPLLYLFLQSISWVMVRDVMEPNSSKRRSWITKIILTLKILTQRLYLIKKKLKIVKNVSFQVKRGKTLAVVGESGCGKSVTMNSIMRFTGKECNRKSRQYSV